MVKAWQEQVVIPTYEPGQPEQAPIFLENRVYQGSSGVVYPYPVIESVADVKTDHSYRAVWLENEYVKIMILPELGGRIQMAYDKIRQRHFIYYNQVVKPALVGLAGPWISGGIEFNWPQHHRPSTFMEVDSTIEEHPDGSVTVWVGERERMFHQKGMAGFTLRPGCAYLEIQGVVYNPTELPQTFLWWANPAVHVGDHYQSVFPPDVNAVFDHGKRAVSTFPIATGTYYKVDYSAGVDISNYRNIPVPTSYMVAHSDYNFEGGYENDTRAGMLHVADHRVAPGKKQWTWGNGDFGRAWDRNLTDEDGPYIELMAGVYTENQPDFTWLMPCEEKRFVQYFMPYRELGMVKNASRDLLLNMEPTAVPGEVRVMVFATSAQSLRVRLVDTTTGLAVYESLHDVSPEQLLDTTVNVGSVAFSSLCLQLITASDGRVRLSWQPEPEGDRPIPDAAEAALLPKDIATNDQLYLTGLHLEQYRHATWSALDYYEEALRRDPLDVRCNNAVGLWYLRRGRFAKAESYLRTSVRVWQKRNPNPYDGEPLYNLALCLKYRALQDGIPALLDEAYDLFVKSTWNHAWQAAGWFSAAQISLWRGDDATALEEVDKALVAGWHNHKARALKALLLRRLGHDVSTFAAESLAIDPLNAGILYAQGYTDALQVMLRGESHNYDELALDYLAAGLFDDALAIWNLAVKTHAVTAMTTYYRCWTLLLAGRTLEAEALLAADEPRFALGTVFPNRLEAIVALQAVDTLSTVTARSWQRGYLLGNIWYDKRQYDLAGDCWRRALALDTDAACPILDRNLALLSYNKLHDAQAAEQYMQSACRKAPADSRLFMEYDQLLRRLGYTPAARLARFEAYPDVVVRRDDLVLEKATLLNLLGRHEESAALIAARQFHPWEGGEGKVSTQYRLARLAMARQLLQPSSSSQQPSSSSVTATDLARALRLLEECLTYPANLGEGKLIGAQDNDVYYYLGCAYHQQGDETSAQAAWRRGTQGPTEPAAALYYNDAQPDKIYYAALCYRALGDEAQAQSLFHKLIAYGEAHLTDHITMDYFAVSLPDLLVWDGDLDRQNRFHCHYLQTLGYTGLGSLPQAHHHRTEALRLDPYHQGLSML